MLCYIGLGANLGGRAQNLARAFAALTAPPLLPLRASRVYETAPVGYTDQPPFLNMVVALRADCDPFELLRIAQSIEEALQRRRTIRYGPRPIDVDLLCCDDMVLETERLVLPHPCMAERQFVLVPLADIAPELRLRDGSRVGQRARREEPGVRPLGSLRQAVRREMGGH